MTDQPITRLRVECADGLHATITAMRIRAGELLADYAIEVIAPGINVLLAMVLAQIGSANPAIDEQGCIVPLPPELEGGQTPP